MSDTYYLLTFDTTAAAMQADALLQTHGGMIAPVPTEIDAGCGLAVRLSEREPGVSSLQGHVSLTGLYRITGRGSSRVIERVM